MTHIEIFLGKVEDAKRRLEESKVELVLLQISPDFTLHQELKRKQSLGYSIGALMAIYRLSLLAEGVGISFWDYEAPDGRSFLKVIQFLSKYVDRKVPWIREEVVPSERMRICTLFKCVIRASKLACHQHIEGLQEVAREFHGLLEKFYPETITNDDLMFGWVFQHSHEKKEEEED